MIMCSWQTASRIRAMLSLSALLALSSAVMPGTVPHRMRAVRTGGAIPRLQVSRWCGAAPPDALEEVSKEAGTWASAAAPAGRPADRPFLPDPLRRTIARILAPSLAPPPWTGLSAFESRPPPVA